MAAAAGALSGRPTSSAFTRAIWKPYVLALFASSMATSTALTSLMPSCWLSPDSGPSKPILTVPPPPAAAAVPAAADVGAAPRPPPLDLLLLPQPVRATAPAMVRMANVRVLLCCIVPPTKGGPRPFGLDDHVLVRRTRRPACKLAYRRP